MKTLITKTKQKSEDQKIDEEIRKIYKEMPPKKHNDLKELSKWFVNT